MNSVGYLNGQWMRVEQMSLGLDDIGFLQGVTAVERLRTWRGRLPLLPEHLRRFLNTTAALRIRGLPPPDQLGELAEELLARNATAGDTGIVLFATPGRRRRPVAAGNTGPAAAPDCEPPGTSPSEPPTLGVHCSPLDFARLDRLRQEGQPLVITDVRQPPLDCWPRELKVRCRIHYYLADQLARDRDPEAGGVLLDDDGSITETSTANVLAVIDGELWAPPVGRVLPGVMLHAVCRLAEQEGIAVHRRPISVPMLHDADEVLLTGSEAGLWPARQIDQTPKSPGPLCRRLQDRLHRFLCPASPHPFLGPGPNPEPRG